MSICPRASLGRGFDNARERLRITAISTVCSPSPLVNNFDEYYAVILTFTVIMILSPVMLSSKHSLLKDAIKDRKYT